MKKILLTSVLALSLAGCGSNDDTQEAEKNTITPPTQITQDTSQVTAPAQQAQQPQASVALSDMYSKIHQGIYLLKQAQDPNLDQILDKIEMYGADNDLNIIESKEILDLISKHISVVQNNPEMQAPSPAASDQVQDGAESIRNNPNPFEKE